MRNFLKSLFLCCAIYLAAAMIISPVECIAAARSAVMMCADTVIPSLFPFFVCSKLFVSLGAAGVLTKYLSKIMRPVFGVPGCGALAMVIGVISGYPLGASCAAELYRGGYCGKTEAERMLTFCSNSGPLFIIGIVGVGIFKNQNIGIVIYISHILSAMLTGMIFKRYGTNMPQNGCAQLPPSFDNEVKNTAAAVGTAVADSVESILKVCGFVVIFAVLASALPHTALSPFVYAVLEITGGGKALVTETNIHLIIPILSAFIAFSGLSVLLQTASLILPCGLSVKPYILGKLVQSVLSFFVTFALCAVMPSDVGVFSGSGTISTVPLGYTLALLSTVGAVCAVALPAAGAFAVWLKSK